MDYLVRARRTLPLGILALVLNAWPMASLAVLAVWAVAGLADDLVQRKTPWVPVAAALACFAGVWQGYALAAMLASLVVVVDDVTRWVRRSRQEAQPTHPQDIA